jgi:hypothetical protein
MFPLQAVYVNASMHYKCLPYCCYDERRRELLHTLCQRLILVHCIHIRIFKFCISFVRSCVIQDTQLFRRLISLRCGNRIRMFFRFLSLKLKPFLLSDCRFVLVCRIFKICLSFSHSVIPQETLVCGTHVPHIQYIYQ